VETIGASAKEWLVPAGGSHTDPTQHWLFKPAHFHQSGHRQLGDWTEMIASRIALHLDIPAAMAQLAQREGVQGVLIRNVRPDGYDMHTGRLAMLDHLGIGLRHSSQSGTASKGHTLENIQLTLEGLGAPPEAASWRDCSAYDAFVGHLMLDALIANQDRHEQNWSVLFSRSAENAADALAPAYDMAASLGFQLTDQARESRLERSDGMEAFARKGYARRFDGDEKTSLVSFAARAYQGCTDPGRRRIERLLEAIATMEFNEFVAEDPSVSVVARRFAVSLLRINGRRITDDFGGTGSAN